MSRGSTNLQKPALPNKTIVLVGLMGAGKSTVGRRLARQIGRRFKDADDEIEKASAMKISDYFSTYGEPAFRDGEARVIERLLDGPPIVLATGGGAFVTEATRTLIQDKAISIWLRADLDVLVQRTARRNIRPLLRAGNPRDILEKLLHERGPIYAKAHLTVESSDIPHAATVERIIDGLKNYQDTS